MPTMIRRWWAAGACCACLMGGYLVVGQFGVALTALAVGTLVLCFGSPTVLASIGVLSILVAPEASPDVLTFGGATIRATDIAVGYVLLGAAVRGQKAPALDRRLLWLTGLLVGWGALRTGIFNPNLVSFLHILEPLLMAWALPRFVPVRRMWSIAAVVGAVLVLTSPYLTVQATGILHPGADRFSGLTGGPNQLGSVAGAVLLIGWLKVGWRRWAAIVVGCLGLWYSRSLSSIAAVAIALLVAQGMSGRVLRRTRPFAPFIVLGAIPAALYFGPKLRDDAAHTIMIHIDLASAITRVLEATNPLIGGGWQSLPPGATKIASLHTVYLDWLAYLGFIGLALLGLWLVTLIRRSADPVGTSVAVLAAIWLNTTGAFPCPAWGLLALALAATRRSGGDIATQPIGRLGRDDGRPANVAADRVVQEATN